MALKETNARLAELASRCAALEVGNKALRSHLAEQLTTALAGALHEIQDSIHIPVDGKDGVPLQGGRGEKGISGDVLTITAKDKHDIRQYARRIRKNERVRHASHLERLHNSLLETYGNSHRGLRTRLAELKSEIAELGDVG
jgi:hypothetical protein